MKCAGCPKDFTPRRGGVAQVYCSRVCGAAAVNVQRRAATAARLVIRRCQRPGCHKDAVRASPAGPPPKYCSRVCGQKHRDALRRRPGYLSTTRSGVTEEILARLGHDAPEPSRRPIEYGLLLETGGA